MHIAILLCLLAAAHAQHNITLLQKAPEWLRPCRRKDPQLNSCIRDTFQHMFPALARGIPEINVERFEPLYISKLSLTKGHGPVTISGSFHDIMAHGPSNSTATYALMDLENHVFELGVFLPDVRIEAEYDLKGKILILPLLGSGPARMHLHNVTTLMKSRFDLPRIDNREVIHLTEMSVDFEIEDLNVHLENLFNGNKVLGRTLNNFLNKNSQEIVSELKEPLGESFAVFFKNLTNNALQHMPIDLWLL